MIELKKSEKKLTFPDKIQYLLMFVIVIGLIGLGFINKDHLRAMQTFSGVLIGVVTFFLVTAVLKGVLGKLESASKKLQKEAQKKISASINKELKEKDFRKKYAYHKQREFLYQIAGTLDIKQFRGAIKISFIVLILSVIIGFFEFITPFNLTNQNTNTILWTLSSWHVVYILIIIGVYFILKLVFYYDEMIGTS